MPRQTLPLEARRRLWQECVRALLTPRPQHQQSQQEAEKAPTSPEDRQ